MSKLRYAPLLAALCVILVIAFFGTIGYARKGGQVETRDPAIVVSTPTPTPQPSIGYFDLYNDRTAIAYNPADIIGEVASVGDWSLVLLRGGGRIWIPSEVQP